MASYAASAPHSTVSSSSPHQSAITPTPTASSVHAAPTPASVAGSGVAPISGAGAGPPQHKRVYQACIPCRRRKVRCDLGSVDAPHDPPCVRCRRESKECFFSATRRKRKADDEPDEFDADDYIVRNGRKRLHPHDPSTTPRLDTRYYSDVPLTPGGSSGRSQPLQPPSTHRKSHGRSLSDRTSNRAGTVDDDDDDDDDESNTQLENIEAQTVMRAGVYGPHDALDLLYKAATDNPGAPDSKHDLSSGPSHEPLNLGQPHHVAIGGRSTRSRHPNSDIVSSSLSETLPHHSRSFSSRTMPAHQTPNNNNNNISNQHQAIDPDLVNDDSPGEPGYAEALRTWARFRFVRAGWFTAQEAIAYIDYYYEYLSPLTPISPPTFRNPGSHVTLLTEEPILTVTLLTISSRYRQMPGPGGHCRSHAIHEQLWSYLRGMIERCLWGQEAFGGGFCGSGADSLTSSTAPWRGLRKGSLRTLGTIESLMILTEWHPRALHFPPAEAIDELMLPSFDTRDNNNNNNNNNNMMGMDEEGNRNVLGSVGGRRIESWLEPAWRSDRMCWMLLSTAMGLAYELGVFDDIDELLATGAITRPEYEDETYRHRSYRIKRLLLIYLTQLAGRLGWTNMVPESLRRTDPAVSGRRPTSVDGATPGTNPSSMSNSFNYVPDLELDDQIIHCWAGISNVMHVGNEKLFRSRKHTTDIIQSGKYLKLLKEFQPMLKDWLAEFQRFQMPMYIRHILTIEFQYVRIYINSLSLQAVVERCASNAGGTAQGGSSASGSAAQLSPQTQNYYGKLPLSQLGGFGAADQEYIREVVDGSRQLLRTVVEGLLPGDYLKHAPVRTYFRIISGAMFLLKTFALGAPKSDVEVSIGLMDQTVNALRNCVVDDVHLGKRFADLLESLTSRLRNRFINVGSGATAASNDGRSPTHAAGDSIPPSGLATASTTNGTHHPHHLAPGDAQSWLGQAHKVPDRSTTPANISATPFDVITSNMPYPSGQASVLAPSTPAASGAADPSGIPGISDSLFDGPDWHTSGSEMWYLPAGPAFFQNIDNPAVAMTAEGVNVGGMDLLEYMAMDQLPMSDTNNGY